MARKTLGRCPALLWFVLSLATPLLPVAAQDAAELRSRMVSAYQRTQTYRATVSLSQNQQQGRWRLIQTLEVAFDRSSSNLRFDRPDMLLISSGKVLRYRSDLVPGRHLEMMLSEPLDWSSLLATAPFLARQLMPDVTLLLGGDPVPATATIRVMDNDGWGRPGLRYDTDQGAVTLRLDPDSYLVREATLERPATVERGRLVGPVTTIYDISVSKHNEQFEQEWFEFDMANSQPVSSWATFLAGSDAETGGLESREAPSLELRTVEGRYYKLSKDSKDVQVLCFWASWGGPPCYRVLPMLQELSDWATREGRSVSVYTVNMRESADEVRQVWMVKGLNLPVLMDSDGAASAAWRVGPIPQTVVVHNGKVAHVHVGDSKDLGTTLRNQVTALLQGQTMTRH